jgi:hypothetical protein
MDQTRMDGKCVKGTYLLTREGYLWIVDRVLGDHVQDAGVFLGGVTESLETRRGIIEEVFYL